MKKIPALFMRNYEGDRLVRDEVVPGSEWVIAGEGIPTRKYDGTAVMIRNGQLFKRFDAKPGRQLPLGFEPCQDFDPVTGHQPGWVPADSCFPGDKWLFAAISGYAEEHGLPPEDGTYEAIGPKINGNPEGKFEHTLVRHGSVILPDGPRNFHSIRSLLEGLAVEGIVWHHPDGRMVKIKRRDFGLPWGVTRDGGSPSKRS